MIVSSSFRWIFAVFLLVIGPDLHAQISPWHFTGPHLFPSNLTGQINGIGRVCQIKPDPLSANTWYACSASGGIWKSNNNGQSWKVLGTDALPLMNTSSICIDYTNPDIIYFSSGDPNYYTTDFGIWKTTNGGQTWVQSNAGISTRLALELVMDPIDHLTLLAATSSGIWKTSDGGQTWSEKLNGNNFCDMKWNPQPGSSVVYASSMNKFFRSTDRGDSWTEITAGFGGILAQGTRLAVSPSAPNMVYVGTVQDEGTIFLSTDSGLNFQIKYHDPNRSLTGYDTTGGGQGNYNFCIEAHPTNPNQLYLGSHNVWRSDDSGTTWQKLTNWWQTVHTDMHDWEFHPLNPTQLFQANDGGVWLTADSGVNWVQRSDSLGATENYHAACSPLYQHLISTGTQDNGELVYLNASWKTNRGGDWTTRMTMDYSPQKFVYYFDDLERRALPSGGGNSYNLPAGVASNNIRHSFSTIPNVAFVAGNSVWRTTNHLDANPVWTQIIPGTASIRALYSVPHHPNILAYAASNKIYISYNALSSSPSFVNYTLPVTGNASDIVISSKDTNHIYILVNTKVWRSTNGGQTFTDYSNQLPATAHFKLFLDDYSQNETVYVGNSLGIYTTDTVQQVWSNYGNGLPLIASIEDFMCFNDGGTDARLFVSYYGRGTWEQKLVHTSSCQSPVIGMHQWVGSSYQINWSSVASAHELQVRPEGETSWTTVSVNGISYLIQQYNGCTRYEARVRARCGADSSLWSARIYFETPSNPLNNDFDGHQDIGNTGAAGSVCFDAANQRYTIYAAGDDIWGSEDQFHFLFKKVSGDVELEARVKHVGNVYSWAKAGVMIRETLNTDSKHSMCVLTPGNGFANQWREQTAGGSDNKDTSGTEPGWVKLERLGNTFNSYFSTDGSNWNLLNTASITMQDTVYVGLANCSHIDGTLNDGVFDNIRINGVALHTSQPQPETALKVYPNPAHDIISFQLKNPGSGHQIRCRILDASGHEKITKVFPARINTYSLNIQTLPPGIYFILVEGDLKYATRFVKH